MVVLSRYRCYRGLQEWPAGLGRSLLDRETALEQAKALARAAETRQPAFASRLGLIAGFYRNAPAARAESLRAYSFVECQLRLRIPISHS